jgi:hypothetical protein
MMTADAAPDRSRFCGQTRTLIAQPFLLGMQPSAGVAHCTIYGRIFQAGFPRVLQ